MKHRAFFALSLVFAWILWQRVASVNSRSDQWIHQTSYQTQQICIRDGSRVIDELRNDFLRRGLGAAYIFGEGIGGFKVDSGKKHIFMCYSSDFDPRPKT
jgi:hypothetical protein